MSTPAPDPLRTTAQAAEYLGTSTTTIRRMHRDGEIKAVRTRGTLKFRQSWLDAYIDEHTESNAPRERKPRQLPERRTKDIEQRYPHLAPRPGAVAS